MTEPVSGMPAPQLGDESSWVRGSELVQGSSSSVFRPDWCKIISRTPGWRPLYLDYRLTDGGEVVGLSCRLAALYVPEDSWYLFLLQYKTTLWAERWQTTVSGSVERFWTSPHSERLWEPLGSLSRAAAPTAHWILRFIWWLYLLV
jgi:hypothetical protein